ncbi:alpha/beta-hydrolase [Cristinia sonorae]|uniref:Alpha/beta-hydrolase n=1 Tax=Cristinia sonorae TaxID=1940300 RepID=A0A8K0UV92_9AGAR|nr:alpha/beta-hydrolase [Cristinia sonorae]
MAKIAPYGTWESPITADSITQNSVSVQDTVVDPITSVIYHVERRPSEGGRSVLVKTEAKTDLFGEGWNCRTGVQEYGGAPAIVYGGTVYFSNFKDGRVYVLKEGGQPEAVTPESEVHRFADFAVHPVHTHLVATILEDHTNPVPEHVKTTLALINTKTKTVHPLLSGADFYAAPAFSPDGTRLAWQQWQHPDMPWEGGEVYVGEAKYDSDKDIVTVGGATLVAGKRGQASANYPFWVTNDAFIFTVDLSGFQNPWIYTVSTGKASPILSKPLDQEFSLPAWILGGSYGVVAHASEDPTKITVLFTAFHYGRSRLYLLTLHSGAIEELDCPYVTVASIRRVADGNVVFLGSKVDESPSIVHCTLKDYATPHFTSLTKGDSAAGVGSDFISKPLPITLTVPPNDEPLYVVYYPPTNPGYKASEGELPPGIVHVHGGPTSHGTQGLAMTQQYFTSRGWAWINVEYGGSSGHGRAYIERLKGNWGIVDTRDCVLAAQGLSKAPHNLVDPKRIVIRGGSSGGYTVLQTLCEYPTAFAAGTSLYGISDLKKLAEFTHKFESQYMAKLLGGFVSEIPEVYAERSPVNNASKIRSPLLIEQGSLDAVVPPGQAEDIVKSIKAIGGRVEYVVFEGEGHGWRKAETIKAALEKELSFYEQELHLKQ